MSVSFTDSDELVSLEEWTKVCKSSIAKMQLDRVRCSARELSIYCPSCTPCGEATKLVTVFDVTYELFQRLKIPPTSLAYPGRFMCRCAFASDTVLSQRENMVEIADPLFSNIAGDDKIGVFYNCQSCTFYSTVWEKPVDQMLDEMKV